MIRRLTISYTVLLALIGPRITIAEDWPTFMHDRYRSGVTTERLELPLAESWTFEAIHPPEPAWPEPAKQDYWHRAFNLRSTVTYDRAYHVVGNGNMVFFGSSSDDKVYALDARTGRHRWIFFTEGPVRFAPFISNEKVYIGSDDGCVYCLSRKDGSLIWKHQAVETNRMIPGNGRMISMWPIRTGLIVDNNNLYFTAGLFPNHGTFLSALDAEDGRVRWQRKIDKSPQGYLLASDERLYVPTGRTNPVMFARSGGRPLGELQSEGGTFALLTEDILLTGPGRQSQNLNAVDVNSGDRLAKFGGVRILVNGSTAYMQSEKRLTAFDRSRYIRLVRERNDLDGRQNKIRDQIQKADNNTSQSKSLQEQLEYLTAKKAELSQKLKDCYLWVVECECPYSMIMAGRTVFAGGRNEVVAFKAQSGEVVWKAAVDGDAYGLSAMNGALYVSTDKGLIYCFRQEGKNSPAITMAYSKGNPQRDHVSRRPFAKEAKLILGKTGVKKGYCLVLDESRGRLACELARESDLKIICVEEPDEVAEARKTIDKADLYGRIVVHQHRNSELLPYTDYFANLIVSDKTLTGILKKEVLRILRPCGGILALTGADIDTPSHSCLSKWKYYGGGNIRLTWAERKSLEGTGEWTHIYAEPGNSACSGDKLIRGPMALQWFGRPGPREMIDRHHRNVPPLYKDGRLFVPGDCVVFAVDAYNGTIQWKISIPDSRRLGVFLDSSSMVVDECYLYIAAQDKCLAFDVRTGECKAKYDMPQLIGSEPWEWGYIAYSGNTLFGSGRRKGASYTETSYEADDVLWNQNMKLVVSDYLFAIDEENSRPLWSYKDGLIINTTISIGGGRVYFVETNSPKALADKLGRMPVKTLFYGGDQYLVALDAQSGQVIYKTTIDVSDYEEPMYLNFAKDILLLSGSRLAGGIVHYYYNAFNANRGDLLWKADHGTNLNTDGEHGEYNRHPTIIEDTIYAWPYAYNLKTGDRLKGWKFNRRGHGCGGVSASAHALFWRGGNPWMYDLSPNGGPQQLTSTTRQGCWINVIPAGGLVLIPESSSGCTCGFALQTSLAFIPQ